MNTKTQLLEGGGGGDYHHPEVAVWDLELPHCQAEIRQLIHTVTSEGIFIPSPVREATPFGDHKGSILLNRAEILAKRKPTLGIE